MVLGRYWGECYYCIVCNVKTFGAKTLRESNVQKKNLRLIFVRTSGKNALWTDGKTYLTSLVVKHVFIQLYGTLSQIDSSMQNYQTTKLVFIQTLFLAKSKLPQVNENVEAIPSTQIEDVRTKTYVRLHLCL